ncbi:MAG: flavodoxin family protein [Parcubacteria group bacterium]
MENKTLRVLGISGSPRKKGTNFMVKTVLEAMGCDYELINLKDKNIKPCTACRGCYKTHECIIKDDMQDIYDKLRSANIIVLGSPTYFDNVTAQMKAFIDRCLPFYLSEKLKNKKVALVSVGNFTEGEVDFLDNYNPNEAVKDPILKKEMEGSVKNCINSMKNFCRAMKLNVVGSIIAINGDPTLQTEKLKKLGRKLTKI